MITIHEYTRAGNMWSQSWNNIEDIVKPYVNGPVIDVESAMKEQVTLIPVVSRLNTFLIYFL